MSRRTVLLACVLASLAIPVFSEDCPEFVGEWPLLKATSISEAGGTAYIGGRILGSTTRAAVAVADVSDPSAPRTLGWADLHYSGGLAWEVREIAVSGELVFVGAGPGLHVIDASDHSRPVEIGWLDTPDDVRDLAVFGNYVYLANFESIRVIDVSNPSNPVQVGVLDLGWSVSRIAYSDGFVFAIYQGDVVLVVDVRVPSDPRTVLFINGHDLNDLIVDGDFLYVSMYSEMVVFDISSPLNPLEVGSVYLGARARRMAVSNGALYASTDWGLWVVVDVSTPSSPVLVGTFSFDDGGDWSVANVAADGSQAYLISAGIWLERQVLVLDVSDLQNPTISGRLAFPAEVQDVAVTEGIVAVAMRWMGVMLIDASTPTNPLEVGFVPTWADNRVAFAGNHLLVASLRVLRVLDISDPTRPSVVSTIEFDHGLSEVAFGGGLAYVVGNRILHVIDVADPLNPVPLGTTSLDRDTIQLEAYGDCVYSLYEFGLAVIDVSDPLNPAQVSRIGIGGWATEVALDGDYAFVSSDSRDLVIIFDVSTPASPFVAASVDMESAALHVAVDRGYAYVGTSRDTVVIDVSEPTSPTVIGVEEFEMERAIPYRGLLYTSALQVFRGCGAGVFDDSFESGDTSAWSATVP